MNGKKLLIGICDDERHTHDTVENLIETYMRYNNILYELIHYYSGQEVLNDIVTLDCLLLDIDMPEMDGIQVANAANSIYVKNMKRKIRREIIEQKMELLGITNLGNKLPSQLSEGQQQRVAIARVLATDNPIILADEPTGALDQSTSRDLMRIFRMLNENGKTIIVITHDIKVAQCAKKIIQIVDGKLEEKWEI